MEEITALHDYLELLSITILYYDHIVTFPEELQYIWKRPLSMASAWFLVNRYIPFLGTTLVLGLQFDSTENESCRIGIFARQLLLVVSQFVICTISTIRAYALYGRSRRILALILTIGLGGMSVVCWSLVNEHGAIMLLYGGKCLDVMAYPTAIHLAAAWEAGLMFDLLIFALIGLKSYQTRVVREWSKAVKLANVGLMQILLQDGALYFGIISLANLANVLTFYLAPLALKGALSTFSNCMSTTMMSRLMLHIHEVIAAPPLGDMTVGDLETLEFNAAQMTEHSANAGQSISEDASRDATQCRQSGISRSMHQTV